MKLGKKRMFSDHNFSSKSHSVCSSDDLAPPSYTPSQSLFNPSGKENLNSNSGLPKMSLDELKQLLIKTIVPDVVTQINFFAQAILDYPQHKQGLLFKPFMFEKSNQSTYQVSVNKSLLRESLSSSITVNGNPLSTYTNYNDPFLEDFHKLEPPSLLSFVKKPLNSMTKTKASASNNSQSSIQDEISSFTNSFDSGKPPKKFFMKPKNKKSLHFPENKSKIDWNLKYQFPKTLGNLFDYQVKSSKIDLLNKNLEKKITSSQLYLNQEPDVSDDIEYFEQIKPTSMQSKKVFKTSQILNPTAIKPQVGYPALTSMCQGSGPISFLEAVQSLSMQFTDGYKQQSLTSYTSKNEKPPPPADLFANLPSASSFTFSQPLFTQATLNK